MLTTTAPLLLGSPADIWLSAVKSWGIPVVWFFTAATSLIGGLDYLIFRRGLRAAKTVIWGLMTPVLVYGLLLAPHTISVTGPVTSPLSPAPQLGHITSIEGN